jgi:hypothetical protein
MRVLIAVACLELAACTMSEVPITALPAQPADSRLLGEWRVMSFEGQEDDRLSVRLLPNGNLLVEDIPDDGSDPAERMEVITAHIDGEHYASVRAQDHGEEPPSFMLLRYEHQSRDRVQLYLARIDRLEKAVLREWITGSKRPGSHFDSFLIEAAPDALRKFIAARGRGVFSAKGPVLQRARADRAAELTPRRR